MLFSPVEEHDTNLQTQWEPQLAQPVDIVRSGLVARFQYTPAELGLAIHLNLAQSLALWLLGKFLANQVMDHVPCSLRCFKPPHNPDLWG